MSGMANSSSSMGKANRKRGLSKSLKRSKPMSKSMRGPKSNAGDTSTTQMGNLDSKRF